MEKTVKTEEKQEKEYCPKCGERAGLPISYGMPSSPEDDDYYYVRCCTILKDEVNMACTKCHHRWHSPRIGKVQ